MTAVMFVTMEANTDKGIQIIEHDVTGSSYMPIGSVIGIKREETVRNKDGAIADACTIMAHCNDARLIGNDGAIEVEGKTKDAPKDATIVQYAIEGEPTEASLLCLLEKLGPREIAEESESIPSILASLNYKHFVTGSDRYATLEFDRQRKRYEFSMSHPNVQP